MIQLETLLGKSSIISGFSIAMFDCRRVLIAYDVVRPTTRSAFSWYSFCVRLPKLRFC